MTVCLIRRVVGSSNLVTWNSVRFISPQRALSILARGNARPSDVYKQMIEQQTIKPDAVQLRIVQYFDSLSAQMDVYERNARFPFYLLKQQVPRGIYLHGSVGCGKTMLMDIFYATCNYKLKWRTHFHAFMRTIHERLHVARQVAPRNRPADPIPSVARDVSNEFKLLCLDEFQVTDIADAMILKRLFENLFKCGAVVVATSNREPDELYKHGLQRVNFLPFIDLLKKQCLVLNLDSPVDYRHELMSTTDESEFNVYYVYEQIPDADSKLDKWFIKLAADDGHLGPPVRTTLDVYGRSVVFSHTGNRVAMCSFGELCDQPLGAADYLKLASHFHTILLRDLPELGPFRLASLKRFTLLIDVLYDNHVRLLVAAHRPRSSLVCGENHRSLNLLDNHRQLIDDLGLSVNGQKAPDVTLFTGAEDMFAFARTLSRLEEMCTPAYWHRSGPKRSVD